MAELVNTQQTLDVRTLCGLAGKCALVPAAGTPLIAAQTQGQIFVDQIGQAATSNIVQTRADGNYHGGAVPQGEIFTVFSFAIAIQVLNGPAPFGTMQAPAGATPELIQDVIDNVSFELLLKGQTQQIASPFPFPSTKGGTQYSRNGGQNVPEFAFPPSIALQIESNQSFSVRFTAERAITMLNNDDAVQFSLTCAASRGIPIANLPGA